MIPSGIEPATFRFVAQRLNHCATASREVIAMYCENTPIQCTAKSIISYCCSWLYTYLAHATDAVGAICPELFNLLAVHMPTRLVVS